MKDKISNYYGKGGRLSEEPAQSLIESAYRHDTDQGEYLLHDLHVANLAHVVMLTEQEIIPSESARIIVPELINLIESDEPLIDVNPKYGDIYNCVDVYLKNKIGQEAGWVHAGRARREAVNIAFLLRSKRALLETHEALVSVAESLHSLISQHHDTVMSDYTYLHHAQPTTLAHYLLTFLTPLLRDIERVKRAFNNLDHCPAGSGSVNGSRLPLDKSRLTELLGFAETSIHCRDAMWQPDVPLEVVSSISTSLVNLSRLCEEWIVWNSKEFGLIELPDRFCRASVIMPQKKNPYPLAYMRGLSSNVTSLFSEYSSLGKGMSGFPDTRTFVYDSLISALDRSTRGLGMLAELIKDVKFNKARMQKVASESFGFSTDLADFLIMNRHCDYRTAHTVVGQLIKYLVEQDLSGSDATLSLLNEVLSNNGLSKDIVSKNDFDALTTPENIVAARTTLGGASNEQVHLMQAQASKQIEASRAWIEAKQLAENKVDSQLTQVAQNLLQKGIK